MGDSLDQSLTRAYDLIEQDKLDAARAIIEPFLEINPDNADVWWLYSHAVEDPDEARKAIQQVMRIDPAYPGALELSQSLESDFPGTPAPVMSSIKPLDTPAQPVSPPAQLPDFPQLDEEPEWLTDQWDDDTRLDQPEPTIAPASLSESSAADDSDWFDDWEDEPAPVVESDSGEKAAAKPDWLEDDWDDDDIESVEDQVEVEPELTLPRSRRRLLIPLSILALVVVVVIIAVLLMTSSRTPAPTVTATQSVAQVAVTVEETAEIEPTATQEIAPTEVEPTATPEVVPTETEPTPTQETMASPMVTDEVTEEALVNAPDFDELRTALVRYNIPENGVDVQQTALGNTLIIIICSSRDELAPAMDVLSQQLSNDWADINAVAIQIGDCAVPSTLRTVGVTLENAVSYANGTLTLQEFQRSWTPLA